MKFTTNTKPLAEALNLGVVRKSVSKFYQRSCLAQVTCTRDTLQINLQVNRVISELKLRGSGDEDGRFTCFVDCLLLSDLMNTLDSDVVTIEYVEGGIIIHSGKSKFTLSQSVDATDLELDAPSELSGDATMIDLDKADWAFVGSHQMFAIAMSFTQPVYTRVWVGSEGDVLVGDVDNSIFTHTKKSKFGDTFLLSDTIINLFNALPEGSKIAKTSDGKYQIRLETDSFDYCSEFDPDQESDPKFGSYESETILNVTLPDKDLSVSVSLPVIQKFLSQAALLNPKPDALVTIKAEGNKIYIKDENMDCELPLKQEVPKAYEAIFKTNIVKSILSNIDADVVNLSPRFTENPETGEEIASSLVFWSDQLSIVLGSIDIAE